MIGYVIRRILLSIPVLFGVLLLVFAISRGLPGDPITVFSGEFTPSPEVRKSLERELGLDQPLAVQFLLYCRRTFTGNWGKSIFTGEPVSSLTLHRFGATLELAVMSIIIAATIGLPFGYLGAKRMGTLTDKIVRVLCIGGFSMPVFWWGLLLILIFSVYLAILPPMGRNGIENLILPSLTLATVNFGMIARLTRACMLEVLTQDHVFAARAKGLTDRTIFIRHVLRNAIVPIFTFVGLRFGLLMGGAVITETVFAYPGIGRMIVDAIFMRDYPVIVGGIFFVAVAIFIINLLVDIIYAGLDPRIRYERRAI